MTGDVKYSDFKIGELLIYVRNSDWNGFDLVKKLNENPGIYHIHLRGITINPTTLKLLMYTIEGTQVKCLQIHNNCLCSYGFHYLAEGLIKSNITSLTLYNCQIDSKRAKHLSGILKDTCISCLNIPYNLIRDEGLKYLAEGLKYSNIISLDVRYNGIGFDGIKCLADNLKDTKISYLVLTGRIYDCNRIGDDEVKYLVKHLKNTCITHLGLAYNKIGNDGVRCLAQSLQDTQITQLDFGLKNGDDEYFRKEVDRVTLKNKIIACKIQNSFQKLVRFTRNDNLEFIIPNVTVRLDIEEYLYFIKTLIDTPNVKGHIFDMILEHKIYPNTIRDINEFLNTISDKFNTFFNDKFLELVNLLDDINYTDLVKLCEDLRLYDIVKNLLLHRELFYVDDDKEILHPYIYKMLNKYDMTLYKEQFEHEKKNDIILYFENHPDIDGVHELINLLKSQAY